VYPYIGGKNKIGKWIREQMPSKNWHLYAEIFGGAFWTYLKGNIKADSVIYNDYNPFLYNLWICMVFHRDKLIDCLKDFKPNDLPTYHENKKILKDIEENSKEEFVKTIPNFDIVKRYVYQLTHCFSGDISGGMKRTVNGMNSFNSKLVDSYYINKLNSVTEVTNMDCIDFIDKYDNNDVFFYTDPPYYEKEHLYGFHNFDKQKHYDLADRLKNCKAMWILSYYDYPDLKDLYPEGDFIWLRKEYTRSSSAVPGKPGKGIEVLVFPKKLIEIRNKKGLGVFFK